MALTRWWISRFGFPCRLSGMPLFRVHLVVPPFWTPGLPTDFESWQQSWGDCGKGDYIGDHYRRHQGRCARLPRDCCAQSSEDVNRKGEGDTRSSDYRSCHSEKGPWPTKSSRISLDVPSDDPKGVPSLMKGVMLGQSLLKSTCSRALASSLNPEHP